MRQLVNDKLPNFNSTLSLRHGKPSLLLRPNQFNGSIVYNRKPSVNLN